MKSLVYKACSVFSIFFCLFIFLLLNLPESSARSHKPVILHRKHLAKNKQTKQNKKKQGRKRRYRWKWLLSKGIAVTQVNRLSQLNTDMPTEQWVILTNWSFGRRVRKLNSKMKCTPKQKLFLKNWTTVFPRSILLLSAINAFTSTEKEWTDPHSGLPHKPSVEQMSI